jgi:hypothetical protein
MTDDSLGPFTAEDETVGNFVLVASQHKLELEDYLREVRVPFEVNPERRYQSRKVQIRIPHGFGIFAFGRSVTTKDLHYHLGFAFDGYDYREVFSPVREKA